MNEIEVTLFEPFKPMLAERPSGSDMEVVRQTQLAKATEFYVETKYDGERMQLHKNGSKFRFFSRNGNDFTDDFGSTAGEKFARWAQQAISPSVKTLILDGEVSTNNFLNVKQTHILCRQYVNILI